MCISANHMSNISRFINTKKLHSNEGVKGIENLNKIAKAIGYHENGFLYGSSLEQFLIDNPGAIETLREWILENFNEDCCPQCGTNFPLIADKQEPEILFCNNCGLGWNEEDLK